MNQLGTLASLVSVLLALIAAALWAASAAVNLPVLGSAWGTNSQPRCLLRCHEASCATQFRSCLLRLRVRCGPGLGVICFVTRLLIALLAIPVLNIDVPSGFEPE